MSEPTDWMAFVALITPVALRAEAAHLFALASGNPADDDPATFSVALSPEADPTATPTHYACHTRVRGTTLAQLPAMATAIPGSIWGITAHDDDTPEERAARMDFWSILAANALAMHEEPEE